MRNDNLFRTDQFVEQVAQREQRARLIGGDALARGIVGATQDALKWGATAAGAMHGFAMDRHQVEVENKELAMKEEANASQMATEQIHRKQAEENLRFSQLLHADDMMSMQRELTRAEIDLRKAQIQRERETIDDSSRRFLYMTPEQRDYMVKDYGMTGVYEGGKFRLRDATPAEREAAKARVEYEKKRKEELDLLRYGHQSTFQNFSAHMDRQRKFLQESLRRETNPDRRKELEAQLQEATALMQQMSSYAGQRIQDMSGQSAHEEKMLNWLMDALLNSPDPEPLEEPKGPGGQR